jgi:hypothetical protein
MANRRIDAINPALRVIKPNQPSTMGANSLGEALIGDG